MGGVSTYDRSSGVGGVEPLRLWAKVAAPPSCLAGFGKPPEPMGPTFPKAQPDPLFTGNAVVVLHQYRGPETSTGCLMLRGPLFPYQVFHLVTYLPRLFLYVAIAGRLLRSHQASPVGTAVLFLLDAPVVSLSSLQRSDRWCCASAGRGCWWGFRCHRMLAPRGGRGSEAYGGVGVGQRFLLRVGPDVWHTSQTNPNGPPPPPDVQQRATTAL